MKLQQLCALVFLFLVLATAAQAQNSNAIIFTENDEKFTVILNGLRQNEQPETNVKIEGLNANFYKMKVIFEDAALGQNNFNLGIEPGTETTYIIKKNNKNAYVLRPMSMVPIAQAPPTPQSTQVITYNPAAPAYTSDEIVTHEVTTTTTHGTPTGTGVSMGINVNETGGNINMHVAGMDGTGNTTVQQTTVTTTTTTTTTTPVYDTPSPVVYDTPAPVVYLLGYSGPVGCPMPMEKVEFESMKNSISSKSFEDSKLTIAKQIINSNCLLADHVREIMMLFNFEDSKLDFAKYAYGRTYDIGNYYKVNDAFTFESSIDDLNSFINSGR